MPPGSGGGGAPPGVALESENDAESEDVSQSFDVSQMGDNSNQCVGIRGVANTGSGQNQVGVLQYGSEATTSSSRIPAPPSR